MTQDTEVSLAPLKAWETRTIKWAETKAKTEQGRADFLAEAAGYRKRIDAILGAAPSAADVASETAQSKPEPTSKNVRTPTEPEPALSEPTNLILWAAGDGQNFRDGSRGGTPVW